MPPDLEPAWQQRYGILGAFSTKAPQDTISFLTKEGEEQVNDKNERAPGWTVLGQPSEQPEKVYWAAYFEDYDAYHTDHKSAQEPGKGRANFVGSMMPAALHEEFPRNLAGGHMGKIWHLENPNKVSAGFAVLETFTAPNEQAAQEIVDTHKKHAKIHDACSRITIYGPGADMPPGSFDPLIVHVLSQWVSQEKYDSCKQSAASSQEAKRICFNDATVIKHFAP